MSELLAHFHFLRPALAAGPGASGARLLAVVATAGSLTRLSRQYCATSARTPSTAFRKFVISYGRLCGHGILGYREQSRDEFSRPFGKEAPYANAHCSPHHFIAQRSYGSASGCACPCHTTITGVTRTHCLKGCRTGATDHPPHSLELGCSNLTVGPWRRRSLALGFPGLHDAMRSGRPRTIASPRVSRSSPWPVRCLKHRIAPSPGGPSLQSSLPCSTPCTPTRSAARGLAYPARRGSSSPTSSAYWRNSHDEDFDTKAHIICQLYAKALAYDAQGRLVLCGDEKTGMQVLSAKPPPTCAARATRTACTCVHSPRHACPDQRAGGGHGQIAWTIGCTRTATDFVAHLHQAYQRLPRMTRYNWVLDNFNTHWVLDVCRLVAQWCKVPFAPDKRKNGVQRRAS